MDEKKPDAGAPGAERNKDAMCLLAAIGEIDDRFVTEAADADAQENAGEAAAADARADTGDVATAETRTASENAADMATDAVAGGGTEEAAVKKGVLHFTPARVRGLAGIGIAACLLVAGVVVFTQPDLLIPGNPTRVDVSGQQGQDAPEDEGEPVVLSASPDEAAVVGDTTADAGASDSDAVSASDASAVAASTQVSSEASPIVAFSGDVADGAGAAADVGEPGPTQAKVVADSGSRAASSGAAAETLANPWQWCATLDDAQASAGFSFAIDSAALPVDVSSAQVAYQAIVGELIEVDYSDTSGNLLMYLRKGMGSDDVSGDYTAYDLTQVRRFAGQDVTLRGSDDAWHVATWTANGHAYAIGASSPLTTAQMEALVAGME